MLALEKGKRKKMGLGGGTEGVDPSLQGGHKEKKGKNIHLDCERRK